jgi:hypothetical protein
MKQKLAIKPNNTATNDPCAICGKRTDPDIGPELFMADSWALVCWDCGRKLAPELVAMLEAWRGIGTAWDSLFTDSKGAQL